MDNKRYLLTIRVPIEGMDDLDARVRAKELMAQATLLIDWSDKKRVKLQEISDNKEPRGLIL